MSPLLVGLVGLVAQLPLGATPEPGEVLPGTPPEELVTPGTVGFLVTFAVAVALVLLVRDMTRRNRRIVFEAERRDAATREAIARDAGDLGPADGPGPDGPTTRADQPPTVREPTDGDGDRPAAPNG